MQRQRDTEIQHEHETMVSAFTELSTAIGNLREVLFEAMKIPQLVVYLDKKLGGRHDN